MTDKHRERVAEIVHGAIVDGSCLTRDDVVDWVEVEAATERIHALYSREGAEPVGFAPWHPDADGTVRGGMLIDPDGRLECYLTEKEAEARGFPTAPLYTAPPESRLRKALEEIMHRFVAYREHVATGSQPRPNAASTVREIGDIARRALSDT